MTRTFVPVRCHTAIGVLGAASVAAGLRVPGNVGEDIAAVVRTARKLFDGTVFPRPV